MLIMRKMYVIVLIEDCCLFQRQTERQRERGGGGERGKYIHFSINLIKLLWFTVWG